MSPECLNQALNVLEPQCPKIVKCRFKPTRDSIVHVARYDDPARRRFRLQPGRHIHAVPIKVVAVHDQIAEMQANPEHNAGVLGLLAVCLAHRLLELDGRTNGVHGAGELCQCAIPGQFDQSPAVTGSLVCHRHDRRRPERGPVSQSHAGRAR